MREKHPQLEIAAATVSNDKDAIARWKEKVGADLPILHGVSEATAKAYSVTSYPTFRVIGKDGAVAGSDEATLQELLGS